MLYLLILLLFIILFIAYFGSKKEICSPAVLFTAPFLLMCIIASFFQKEWSFNFGVKTFLIILFGIIFFCIGTVLGNKILLKKTGQNCNISNVGKIKNWKFLAMLFLQLICYVAKLQYIINFGTSHGIAKDISKCLVFYNNTLKFTTDDLIHFPIWLSIGLEICTVFGFISACILAHQLVNKNKDKKQIALIILNFCIAVIGGASSGGRGGAIQLLIALICAYLILYQRKYLWKKSIPIKKILFIVCCLVGIVVLFYFSLTLIGRNEVHMVGRYISNYMGAQLFNLDYVISNGFEKSIIFGQETFYPLIEKIASLLNISKWANYHVGASFVYAAGYNTGNVYTCFYSYIMDFGIFGVIILPLVLGIFTQIVYRFARKSSTNNSINLGLIFYSYLAYMIAFSFFADKFGSIVFTFNTLKKILILLILYVFIFSLNLKKDNVKSYV